MFDKAFAINKGNFATTARFWHPWARGIASDLQAMNSDIARLAQMEGTR